MVNMSLPINPRKAAGWLSVEGLDSDVVISSRVRFARNLREYPFYEKNDPEGKRKLRDLIFSRLPETPDGTDWIVLKLEELGEIEKNLLAERHIISQQLLREKYGGVAFGHEETVGMMINEEDHIRLQAISPGNNLEEPLERANRLERELDATHGFAFHERWGYLTACPTNLGTGFRASVLLHLPGLVLDNKINRVLNAISNLGLTVRGFYGEGSESRGFYFQLSNQVTLGRSTDEFLSSLKRVVQQIIVHERKARTAVIRSKNLDLEDKIGRAYGILRHARKIDSSEAIELLSMCRLGADRDLIPETDVKKLDSLLQLLQPAHLQHSIGEKLSGEDRQAYRAKIVETEFSTAPS